MRVKCLLMNLIFMIQVPDFLCAQVLPDETRPTLDYSLLFQDESEISAREKREPDYLKYIHSFTELKVRDFVAKKELELDYSNKNELRRHAYGLFYSMCSYYINIAHSTWNAAWMSADDIAGQKAWEAVSMAEKSSQLSKLAKVLEDSVLNSLWPMSGDMAVNSLRLKIGDLAWMASRKASEKESARIGNTDPEFIGYLSYRIAEKVSSLFFYQYAETIADDLGAFDDSYQKSLQVLPQEFAGIFKSKSTWHSFRFKYFDEILKEPGIYLVLNPWLEELDELSALIER